MMHTTDLRRRLTASTGRALRALSGVRMAGTAATMAYCAIHLATTHRFSPMMFAGAVVFGAVVAGTAALLSGCLGSSHST